MANGGVRDDVAHILVSPRILLLIGILCCFTAVATLTTTISSPIPLSAAELYDPPQHELVQSHRVSRRDLEPLDSGVQPRLLFGPNYSAGKFNTTVAFTIPLFAFRVPSLSSLTLGVTSTTAIVSVTFLAVLTVLVLFVIPLLGYAQGRTSREDLHEDAYVTDYLTNLVYSALTEISSVVDGTCTERTICEAWRTPHKFGNLASPLRLLYPPDGYEGPRQKAALLGVTDTDTECQDEYDCPLSLMDVLVYLTKFVRVEAPF